MGPDTWREERPDFRLLRQSERTARTPKACELAGCRPITPGERYLEFVYTEDGAFKVARWHLACWHDPFDEEEA